MNLIPQVKHISGVGTPRVIIVFATPQYSSGSSTTFDSGAAYESGQVFAGVQVNQRVLSYVLRGTVQIPTFAKVTGKIPGKLSIDAWTNGTPTNGQIMFVDGYVVDLPRSLEDGLTETYTPDLLIHSIYAGDQGSRIETEMRGWLYDCVLDYSKYASPDMLLDLKNVLALAANDNLILIPRRDCPQFQYNVYFSGPISLSRYGLAPGYKKPIFAFRSKSNLPSWGMLSGHGTNYGNNYGSTGW
jgi:hypothetical protein